MRVLLQRVRHACVRIREDDSSASESRISGRIGQGFLLLVGFTHSDTLAEVQWMADKIAGIRLFTDNEGRMNLGLEEVQGSILIVSQFTLYGDASRGRRPGFSYAAHPDKAEPLYESFVKHFRDKGFVVGTGEFGALMDVELVNDGPVTIWLEREAAALPQP